MNTQREPLISWRFRGGYAVTELDIQREFFCHLDDYLPSASLVTRTDIAPDDRRGIPDGWVTLDGIMCPVEVKQRTFSGSDLSQIWRYMNNYGCDHGVVVAERFAMAVERTACLTRVAIPVDRSWELIGEIGLMPSTA